MLGILWIVPLSVCVNSNLGRQIQFSYQLRQNIIVVNSTPAVVEPSVDAATVLIQASSDTGDKCLLNSKATFSA